MADSHLTDLILSFPELLKFLCGSAATILVSTFLKWKDAACAMAPKFVSRKKKA